jgi:hypothetical protein
MEELLAAALDHEPSALTKEKLAKLWPYVEPALDRALEVRRSERLASLERVLGQREEKELADIAAILNELATVIRAELHQQPLQLSLFSADERDQYVRNVAALEARLAQIPGEIEQEQALVRRRYAGRQARSFPVAVTYLVPERLAGGR